jgi:hypothetical protein
MTLEVVLVQWRDVCGGDTAINQEGGSGDEGRVITGKECDGGS